MKVFIGADHNGYHLRRSLLNYLKQIGYDMHDEGDEELDPLDDFPVFAAKVVKDVVGDPKARGILICGSGQGMCMAANRYKGIRAALGYSVEAARAARNDDDANILCLPAAVLAEDTANLIVKTFLDTKFAASERFKRRLKQLDEL